MATRRKSPSLLRLVASAAILAAFLLLLSLVSARKVASDSVTPSPLYGYLWSDNIGWVDLNCSNLKVCSSSNFGMSIQSDGTVTGYGWSDNVGWISANASDLAGCPSSPCTATVSNGTVQGWFKALAADNNGWDGWISLSGNANGVSYGPTYAAADGTFSGYGWGSDVVGWVDFSYARTNPISCVDSYECNGSALIHRGADCSQTTVTTCNPPTFCSAGSSVCLVPSPSGTFTVQPSLVQYGGTAVVSWNISDAASCTVVGTNGDGTSASTDPNSPGAWSGLVDDGETTSGIKNQTTYTLDCAPVSGTTHFIRAVTVTLAPHYQEK